MIELESAQQRILSALPPPTPEPVPVSSAHDRFLVAPPTAKIDLPPFDNSALDGYAVHARDVEAAGEGKHTPLRLVGRVEAGSGCSDALPTGCCVRVFTGAALPRETDAVVMQEDTRSDPTTPDQILVDAPVRTGEGVRKQGEDVRCGDTLAKSGERISAAHQALLAAAGVSTIQAGQPPSVAVLATGSELVEPGHPLKSGCIYESNRAAVLSLVRSTGAHGTVLPLVGDTLEATEAALEQALKGADVVITTGGVSVGETDHVKEAFKRLGGQIDFWRVAIKPGKPFAYGRLGNQFLFGLPGNPVSAWVTFALLVRPALLRWQGATATSLPCSRGMLAEPLSNPGNRRHFLRVRLASDGSVSSAGLQASHALRSLALANGLVDLAPAAVLPAGAEVTVLRVEG